MEFIVKIGADQQGLQDTVKKMVDEFKRTNVNMPISWAGANQANAQYGGILKNSAAGDNPFEKFTKGLSELSPALGGMVGSLSGVLGPVGLLTAAIGSLGAVASAAGSRINEAAMLSRQSRITGASAGMLDRFAEAAKRSGMDPESAFGAINRLNAQAGGFNNGDATAQALFNELGVNPSGKTVDQLLREMKTAYGGLNDPAKRARISKGLFGRGGYDMSEVFSKFDPVAGDLMSEDLETLAKVKSNSKKFWGQQWRLFKENSTEALALLFKGLGFGKGARSGEFSQTIGEEYAEPGTAAETPGFSKVPKLEQMYRWSDGTMHRTREPARKLDADKALSFAADSLAQAGLFSGSSLLFNPNFTVQQQQLDILRMIKGDTSRITPGTFS